MERMKWNINGKGVDPAAGNANGYNGPDLPKGSWPCRIKRMTVGSISQTSKIKENRGQPRISVLLEVHGLTGEKAKYNGAPIWDGLNVIKSSLPFVNAFLHALTDGKESSKNAIEAAFWDDDKGPVFKRVKVTKGARSGQIDTHIIKIGRVNINSPEGETMIQVTTRAGEDQKGNYRPEVSGYIPFVGPKSSGDDDDDEGEELLDDVDADDDDGDDDADSDEDSEDDADADDDDGDDDDDDDADEGDDDPEDADDADDADAEEAEPVAASRKPF